jgi:hypothetical protein
MENKPQGEVHKLTMEEIKELVCDSKIVHTNRVTNHEEVSEQEESVVDTKTLRVGQHVWIESGPYVYRGIVAKITPSAVEVNSGGQLFHFDSEGKGCNSEGVPSTGPWHINEKW